MPLPGRLGSYLLPMDAVLHFPDRKHTTLRDVNAFIRREVATMQSVVVPFQLNGIPHQVSVREEDEEAKIDTIKHLAREEEQAEQEEEEVEEEEEEDDGFSEEEGDCAVEEEEEDEEEDKDARDDKGAWLDSDEEDETEEISSKLPGALHSFLPVTERTKKIISVLKHLRAWGTAVRFGTMRRGTCGVGH